MKLKLQAPYEPLELEIGGQELTVTIDLTPGNIMDLSKICQEASDKAMAAQKLAEDAAEERNVEKMKTAYKKIAAVIEKPIVAAIGQEGYDDIRKACGGGEPLSKEKCNLVMLPVFVEISKLAKAAQDGPQMGDRAAHYLAEAGYAQPEPYTAL